MHFHLLPRKLRGDRFATQNDEVYPALERAETALPADLAALTAQSAGSSQKTQTSGVVESAEPLRMDADEDRKPRTMEEMIQEAEWLKKFFAEVEETETPC